LPLPALPSAEGRSPPTGTSLCVKPGHFTPHQGRLARLPEADQSEHSSKNTAGLKLATF
ncbi:hypothetical protein NDU88_004719, partial [Pleurodeles waltl]